MKFTFQMYWQNAKGALEPFLTPVPLELGSVKEARQLFGDFVRQSDNIPLHSVTLASEDGLTSERWSQTAGRWHRMDA